MTDEIRLAPADDRGRSFAALGTPSDFDVRTIVANIANFHGRVALEKGLTFASEVAADVPSPLLGHPLSCEQVLHDLVSRALKLASAGGVALAVRCCGAEPGAVEIEFVLRDTGVGLTGDEAACLLGPAHDLAASGHDETDASLTIARRMIEQLGGMIAIGWDAVQGTTLRWTVRFGLARRTARERIRGARVLVVEDNIINQMVAQEILRSAGAVVTLADDGVVALALLERHSFDLVLMDVQMPRMDGYEATLRLRQIPALAGLPVLAMTASTAPEEIARCREVGMNDVVSKPMSPEDFFRTLSLWLPESPADGPSDRAARLPPPESSIDATVLDLPVLDLAVLRAVLGDDRVQVEIFARRFVLTAWSTLDDLLAAHARSDLAAIGMLGHRLRSSAATVGAPRVADLCRSLEELSKVGDLSQVEALLSSMAQLIEAVAERVEVELRRA